MLHKMGVSCLILKNKPYRQLYLIQRENQPFKGLWCLPGGKLEQGETVEEAMHREMKEETGYSIKILHPFYRVSKIKEYHIVTSVAEASNREGEGEVEGSWVRIEGGDWSIQLEKEKIVPGVQEIVNIMGRMTEVQMKGL